MTGSLPSADSVAKAQLVPKGPRCQCPAAVGSGGLAGLPFLPTLASVPWRLPETHNLPQDPWLCF